MIFAAPAAETIPHSRHSIRITENDLRIFISSVCFISDYPFFIMA